MSPMIKMVRKNIAYAVICAAYYVLPYVLGFNDGGGMLALLFLMPLVVFLSSLIHTWLRGYRWYMPVIIGVLWLPNIVGMHSTTVTIYAVIYAGLCLVAQGCAALAKR